jgi:serine/threonine protein kinase
MRISREHAELTLQGDRLHVRRLSTARNSIYVRGEPSEDFTVGLKEDFRIGKTTFRLATASAKPKRRTDFVNQSDVDESLADIAGQPEPLRLRAVLARMGDDSTRPEGTSLAQPQCGTGGVPRHPPALDDRVFGDYEVVDHVYQGKASRILKARHRYLQRWAAIHVLSTDNATDESIARFRRKAQLIANFDHQNVVAAYDAGVLDKTHFLITEYVDGCSLASLIERQTIETRTAVLYVIQAACGLGHAHARNVIHRDVKPAHLLIDRAGTVKLVGWGRAWCTGDWSLSDYEGAGRILGTRYFMAPEQLADSRDVDQRSDVYSLGRTLFALLAASADSAGEAQVDDSAKNADSDEQSLKSLRADIPDALDRVYQKMTDPEIACRYRSMAEVAEALRTCEVVSHDDRT